VQRPLADIFLNLMNQAKRAWSFYLGGGDSDTHQGGSSLLTEEDDIWDLRVDSRGVFLKSLKKTNLK
jgi:hypothetical protein